MFFFFEGGEEEEELRAVSLNMKAKINLFFLTKESVYGWITIMESSKNVQKYGIFKQQIVIQKEIA